MQIIRVSPFTGKIISKDIDITIKQLAEFNAGVPAETAFPGLSFDDVEFISKGITKEEWDRAYNQPEKN